MSKEGVVMEGWLARPARLAGSMGYSNTGARYVRLCEKL